MKFTVDAKAFGAAMAVAGRVISPKSPWPILANVRIEAKENMLTMMGSNGDVTFEADVPASVATAGTALVSHDQLSKFFSAAKGGEVSVEVSRDGCIVKSGRGRIVLATSPIDDYPRYNGPDGALATLDAPALCASLRYCVAAADDSEARYYLRGVYVEETPHGLEYWGTDGHALHHAATEGSASIGGGGIIPTEAVNIITSIADRQETVGLLVCATGWSISAAGVRAFGKVIDATYPDVRRVVKGFGDWAEVAVVAKDDIMATLAIAACGGNDAPGGSRQIVIRGTVDSKIVIFGQGARSGVISAGRAETEALAKSDFSGCVNSKLLAAAMSGIEADSIAIHRCSIAWMVQAAQASATTSMTGYVMAIRANEEEMSDAA